LVAPELHPGKL
jgi:hypothetical protein